ncbi:MAG: ribosome biogenesis GTP-binding protein YihA/YsxC [Patescibacteria group bacterium]
MATVTFLKSAPRIDDLPEGNRPHVAFVGRSNVGKSALLNDLAGTKNLARVSSTPGRTQMVNLFDVDKKFFLVDLPGYGFASGSKAKRDTYSDLVRDYLWQAQQLKLVLLVIDSRLGLTDLDRDMLSYLESGKLPHLIIANKIDKLSRSEAVNLMRELQARHNVPVLSHSNVTGSGKGEIWHAIQTAISA